MHLYELILHCNCDISAIAEFRNKMVAEFAFRFETLCFDSQLNTLPNPDENSM